MIFINCYGIVMMLLLKKIYDILRRFFVKLLSCYFFSIIVDIFLWDFNNRNMIRSRILINLVWLFVF